MLHLKTARLTIIPFTLDLLRVARQDPALVGQRLRMHVPADWPGPDITAALPSFIRQLEPDPMQDDWGVHLVGHTAERTLIGFAGCNNGPPDANGYAIEAMGLSSPGSSSSRGYDASSPIVTRTMSRRVAWWSASGCANKRQRTIA